jgi:hypothetical protein
MKWFVLVVTLALAVAIAYFAWPFSNKYYIHRYRLTLTLDVNGSMHSGSSVVEVTWIQQPQNLPIPVPRFAPNVRGEATVVDLGDGRVVVALLGQATGQYLPTPPEWLVMRAFGLADIDASIPLIARLAGVRPLEGKDIPALVIFADRAKPESAFAVTPSGPQRELTSGVRLLAATIEITSNPVTNQISEQLPWLLAPGRLAVVAWRSWNAGNFAGPAIGPETLFRR